MINAGTATWGINDRLVLYSSDSHEIASTSLSGAAPGQIITVTLTFTTPNEPISTGYSLGPANDTSPFLFSRSSFNFGTHGAAIPPNIITQPLSQTAYVGDSVKFKILALGQTPFSYQWFHDGDEIVGATGDTLILDNIQATAAGSYNVDRKSVV